MALSTFTHLVSAQHLRSGEGEHAMIESRRKDRVFGEAPEGRLTAHYKPNRLRFDSEIRVTPSFALGPILLKKNNHVKTTSSHSNLLPGTAL